jgi:hypothetical protein
VSVAGVALPPTIVPTSSSSRRWRRATSGSSSVRESGLAELVPRSEFTTKAHEVATQLRTRQPTLDAIRRCIELDDAELRALGSIALDGGD